MAEEQEVEEAEIYDDPHMDIDAKIQSVLGDHMKDFEGAISAENLGPKFGVYGSFLPIHQLPSSLQFQPTTPQISQNLSSSRRFSSQESIKFPVKYQVSRIKSLNPTEQTTFKLQTRVRVRVGSDKPPVAPFIIEGDWIRCCECWKWRLLPYGTKPDQLSQSWLFCSMLDWIPGMNCCDISEEDTTRALHALYQSVIQSNFQNRGGTGSIDVNGREVSVKKRKLREQDCLMTSQCNGNELGESVANAFGRRFRKQNKSKVFQTEKKESSTSKGEMKIKNERYKTKKNREKRQ